MSKGTSIFLAIICCFLFIVLPLFFAATPTGKAIWNDWFFDVQKVDDKTNYETIKKVEDTCRAMIASYESDKLVYEQYKDSENKEEYSWAQQAKMRANKTASTYNNYLRENSFIWEENIPKDIDIDLQVIK